VLRENPNSGPANRGMARAEAGRGLLAEAVTHYQRAIYGSWPASVEENRTQTRLELAEVLGKAGRRTEAQGELLSLAANAPPDRALEQQIGSALEKYGLFRQAAALFSRMTRGDPRDGAAWHGLGEAAFSLGDFARARDAFRKAVEADPADAAAAKRLETCDQILALDPTLRGLSAAQRFERSRVVLRRVLDAWMGCVLPSVAAPNVQSAQQELARTARPRNLREAAEENLDLARQIWAAHQSSCSQKAAPDDPLPHIMR